MAALNVNMPDELEQFVNDRVDQKGFSTPTEYVRQLILEDQRRADQERETKIQAIRQALIEGEESGRASDGQLERLLLDGIRSGQPRKMTPQRLAEIREKGLARFRSEQQNTK